MFHIGQKVVCVNDRLNAFGNPKNNPMFDLEGLTKGSIYTIRWCGYDPGWDIAIVRIEEILRLKGTPWEDFPYGAPRFAPLKKKQTSIAVFQEMLVKTPEIADV